MLAHRLVEFAAGVAATEGEGRKIGIDRLAGVTDRGLEGGVRNRQPARARERAQQHGVDDAARFLGGLVHVEQDLFLAALLQRAQQPADVEAAVAHRRALADGEHAVRRGDERRAVGRDEAVEDHAAGFQKLGRQRHVDFADRRVERQHLTQRALGRHHFEIVGRGAGALRHARDLRRLHAQPLALRRGDDPVAQHAAAVAAQRADQDCDGLQRCSRATPSGAARGTFRPHGKIALTGARRCTSNETDASRHRSNHG